MSQNSLKREFACVSKQAGLFGPAWPVRILFVRAFCMSQKYVAQIGRAPNSLKICFNKKI